MLFRLTNDGTFAGDTWHANEEDAMFQVEYEYGRAVGEWLDVPDNVSDSIELGRDKFCR